MSASFPRANRVVDKKDFARVFNEAERIVAPCLVLLYRSNSLDYCRLGLAISKKHAARAVDRNRIKRRIREFFRHRKTRCTGLDLIYVSRPAIRDAEAPALTRDLERLWQKLEERCAA